MLKHNLRLLEHIVRGDIDPNFAVTHRVPLEDAPRAFDVFNSK